jgi:hypothetical protein
MTWQLWDPPAYYVQVEQQQQQIQIRAAAQQHSTESAESYFRRVYDQPWNSVQPDGRINMGNETSASVSPYSEHFRSQVEPGIWCLVNALYTQGYLTVSSCQGHRGTLAQELDTLFVYRSEPYVSIAVHRDCAQDLYTQFAQHMPKHTRVELAHTMSNTHASARVDEQGDTQVTIQKGTKLHNTDHEALGLNYMFQRNYSAWSYITVRINPWSRFNPLHVLRTQREQQLIELTAHAVKNLPAYSR